MSYRPLDCSFCDGHWNDPPHQELRNVAPVTWQPTDCGLCGGDWDDPDHHGEDHCPLTDWK